MAPEFLRDRVVYMLVLVRFGEDWHKPIADGTADAYHVQRLFRLVMGRVHDEDCKVVAGWVAALGIAMGMELHFGGLYWNLRVSSAPVVPVKRETMSDFRGSSECPAKCIGGIVYDAAGSIDACSTCKLVADAHMAEGVVRVLLRVLAKERAREGKSVELAVGCFVAYGDGIGHDLAVLEKAQERADDLEQALSALVAEVEDALPNPKRKGLKAALATAKKVLEEG